MPYNQLHMLHRCDGNNVAIVFIHGFFGKALDTWGDFPRLLAEDRGLSGWDIYSVGYESNLRIDISGIWRADPDLDKVARQFITNIKYSDLGGYKSIAVIAHSMGGLVIQKALIEDVELRNRVSHVFLFGTPSGGLVKAGLFSRLKHQLRDMASNSEFILDLRTQWEQFFSVDRGGHPFKLVVVAGDEDVFVSTSSSHDSFPRDRFPDVEFDVVPGNHLEIVKPIHAQNLSIQLVVNNIMGEAAVSGLWSSARVAVESRAFQQAIDIWLPNVGELDPAALVQLALALESVGRGPEALSILDKNRRSHTDSMGVLAGRLKRRWLLERREEDARRAMELYTLSYDTSVQNQNWSQAYYHGINMAFLTLAYVDEGLQQAKSQAEVVLRHCEMSIETESAKDTKWRFATEGEAHLLLGNPDLALVRYGEALAEEPSPREIESMYQQAMLEAALLGDENIAQRLNDVFRGEPL